MTFKELLDSVVTSEPFEHFVPYNADKSLNFIKDIIQDQTSRTVIVGDWDVDGIHSAKIVFNDLLCFGVKPNNLLVYFGETKSHGIDFNFFRYCEGNNISHVIIVDSSTNNLREIKYLKDSGLKVMVLDHHMPEYTYNDYEGLCTIVNAKLKHNEKICEISAGFLCSLLSDYWRINLNYPKSMDNFIFGFITLHSDGCLLYDPYIKPLVMYPENLKFNYPAEIAPFTNKWTKFNRYFISFQYCPKINNLCRHNRSDLLNLLFFSYINNESKEKTVEYVTALYEETREALNNLCEFSDQYVEMLDNVVLVNIDRATKFTSLSWDFLSNGTGLIASHISEKYNKPAIAYINNRDGQYKCSGRDTTNSVDFYEILKMYNLDGGGHHYAVGFKVPLADFNTFKKQLTVDISNVKDTDIFEFDGSRLMPDSLKEMMYKVAHYNEVAMGKLKPIYIKIKLDIRFREKQIKKLHLFEYAGIQIKDLRSCISAGSEVLIKPDISNTNTALIYYKEDKEK